MSEHRQARRAARHAPIRRATPTRPSASGPGDRIANADEIAGFFREDCRNLRDSLQLEMVAAQYELRMRSVESPEGIPVGHALSAGVVAALERHGDALSHAILRGLEHLARGDTGERSAAAVQRLALNGVALPAKFGDVAGARPTAAWRATGEPGEYVLFTEFEHPRAARHTVAIFVDPRRGGTAKHVCLLDAMTAIDGDGPFHPDAMEALDYPQAGQLVREVLERSFGPDVANADDFRVPIAAARARSMQAFANQPA